MTDSKLTLADLLPKDLSVNSLQMHLNGVPKSATLGVVQDAIREHLTSALNVDVLELIAQAWAKTKDLQKAAAAKENVAGEATHVFLAKHDVLCESKLTVALEFAGLTPITDHLNLLLKASFEGAGVTIKDRCITSMDAGHGKAVVDLHYSNESLLSQSTDWVTLPGKCSFPKPIRISRSVASRSI